jgi:hypothetical protein
MFSVMVARNSSGFFLNVNAIYVVNYHPVKTGGLSNITGSGRFVTTEKRVGFRLLVGEKPLNIKKETTYTFPYFIGDSK